MLLYCLEHFCTAPCTACQVVELDQVTMAEALDERRLTVLVDATGAYCLLHCLMYCLSLFLQPVCMLGPLLGLFGFTGRTVQYITVLPCVQGAFKACSRSKLPNVQSHVSMRGCVAQWETCLPVCEVGSVLPRTLQHAARQSWLVAAPPLSRHAGRVTRVGNASASLFGFDPSQLIGKSIASFVDALSPEEGAAAQLQAVQVVVAPWWNGRVLCSHPFLLPLDYQVPSLWVPQYYVDCCGSYSSCPGFLHQPCSCMCPQPPSKVISCCLTLKLRCSTHCAQNPTSLDSSLHIALLYWCGAVSGEEEDPAVTAQLMVDLARRATLTPGCSWRVGVVRPQDPDFDLDALGELGQAMLGVKMVGLARDRCWVRTPLGAGLCTDMCFK